MIVYVEAVLLDNFFLDLLLGYLTLLLTKQEKKGLPIFLSAFVGSVFALFYPLFSDYGLPIKVLVLLICSFLLTLKKSLQKYLINTFVYATLTFLLSGIISFLLGENTMNGFIGLKWGGVVCVLSIGVLLLVYSVRQFIGFIVARKRVDKYAIAEVINNDKRIKIHALYDSGNLLVDKNGEGVVVTDRHRVEALGELTAFGEMCVHTAGGSKVLPLVKIPEIRIYSRDRENILINVTAALSDLPEEYALILPCD